MSKNYNQLGLEQRYQIEALMNAGHKQVEIAAILGVAPSTICRELKRNVPRRGLGSGEYRACNAQRKTILRHEHKAKRIKLSSSVKHIIMHYLATQKWSPELISEVTDCPVSHETIYKWIWKCKFSNKLVDRPFKLLYKHLLHGKRHRKRGNRRDRRGTIQNRVSIEKRPKIVERRKRLGDMEVDLMIGKNHKKALLIMLDRSTRHVRIKKLEGKNAAKVARAAIACIKTSPYTIRTLTFDNDQAFAQHEKIASAGKGKSYFTRPYTSQDKGSVENRIGVIRRFFPKKTDLSLVTNAEIRRVENQLNNRPLKKFKYKTPNQLLSKKLHL